MGTSFTLVIKMCFHYIVENKNFLYLSQREINTLSTDESVLLDKVRDSYRTYYIVGNWSIFMWMVSFDTLGQPYLTKN